MIASQNITNMLKTNYMPYAMSVIISRAIPEIDGFKPSHRKLLYTMYKMGLLSGNRIKSADVVGQTMRLNPHGDSAIYETMVRLTRGNAALLHPFVDSKGNFGKQYSSDMAYAASRYTEVKLAEICTELFREIDNADFISNYNNTTKEPILFPVTFPNILVTPNQGIAVGMASNICSFNLQEVCENTIHFIKTHELKAFYLPDFSTGGEIIYDEDEIANVYRTGRGSFKLQAKYRHDKKNNCIEIFEIPYTTTIEAIISKIVILVKTNKLREINDVRDETDLSGLKITIDLKKNCNVESLMTKLFKMTPLRDTFNCNFNVLIDNKPKVLGVKEILSEWYEFRLRCVKRRIKFEIDNKTAKLFLLMGLEKVLLDIDRAIRIIRDTEKDTDVIRNLMSAFEIEEVQANYIADIKLRNLNKEYLLSKIKECAALKQAVDKLNKLLNDKSKIDNLICKELEEISKRYGQPRRTQIIDKPVEAEIEVQNYPIKIILTEQNYFKKLTTKNNIMKPDDKILFEIESDNLSDIILFSNQCNAYKLKAYELDECKANSLGDYLPSFLNLSDEERIVFALTTKDYVGNLLFAYDNGKVAKITLDSFATKQNRKKLVNAYSKMAALISIAHEKDDCDYVLIRDTDKVMLFNSKLIEPKKTKSSNGIQLFRMKRNSCITKFILASEFISTTLEKYRVDKIPNGGRKVTSVDAISNGLTPQINFDA